MSCFFLRFDKRGDVINISDKTTKDYEQEGLDIDGNYYVHIVTDDVGDAIRTGAEKREKYLK